MTRKSDILTEIAALQAELTILNRAPADTYSFGTIALFSGANTKWYYLKTGEETWKDMQGPNGVSKDLASWIATAYESNIGYFEIYIATVGGSPIFASA